MTEEKFSLNKLLPANRSARKRRGRGIGSGLGKTCGYGHKGGKARAGRGKVRFFEGGQTPLYRRLPKRGFTPLLSKDKVACINIGYIQSLIDSGKIKQSDVIDLSLLQKLNVIKTRSVCLRVLGKGELSSPAQVSADHFSASALSAIERAGGKIIKGPVLNGI
ncbi:MAG: 50S ribosomal protein L15 [Holosporales bacterium]|jgi:large subunit ribosomal protein L15|nr:50S ribosomal protein L15 [Holosporales bacterium]